jgi:hypothetical protein
LGVDLGAAMKTFLPGRAEGRNVSCWVEGYDGRRGGPVGSAACSITVVVEAVDVVT